MLHRYATLLITAGFFFISCSSPDEEAKILFEKISSDVSGIDFENTLTFEWDFNVYKYRNFYNGGGVAVGDINGDSLPDIFFTGNMVSNRLYLNKGNFDFTDITAKAGVAGNMGWSTGVSFVDINSDKLIDIYVCSSGKYDKDNRRNELYINNGDLTFTERAAEYGLDDSGYGIQSYFFDYDGDGDLDMYLLSNSNEAIGTFDISENERDIRHEAGGDKLYRNDEGFFTDVSEEVGILGSEIGFSLSASVADVNRDGWPDIYVANDFFERDYLYLNNADGTFGEVLDDQIGSISAASMGSDIADLTNDGWPEIYVADMLPESNRRLKQVTTFEDWEKYSDKVRLGYGHQVTRNTLQLNNGDSTFSEVGRLAGVEATDWSWAVLMADYDHNGFTDIFVTNGLVQDITNLDYLGEIRTPDMIRSIITGDNVNFKRLVDMIPSEPIGNVMFAGQGELEFADRSQAWGLAGPGFSSGAAWGDLNGDGALDLVVNDVNGPARLYRNRVTDRHPERNWLEVDLQGVSPNTQAVGAQLEVWAGGEQWYREHVLQRGYQSSVAPGMNVGLGEVQRVDSLRLRWPDGRVTRRSGLSLPARLTLYQSEANPLKQSPAPVNPARLPEDTVGVAVRPWLEDMTAQMEIDWTHRENPYVDFRRERLLVHMRSTEGPALCGGDVNGDGLEDLYLGGARGQAGILLLQRSEGGFLTRSPATFAGDADSEDTDCVMFDANGDGRTDLYVTSGGNSFSAGAMALLDRLYLGDGVGNFARSDQMLPTGSTLASTSSVATADFTGDGLPDLFVGERMRLFAVGVPARGFLLAGDGNGGFHEVTEQWAPELTETGMITDATWTDWDGDGRPDLVVVGEWMAPQVYRNTGRALENITTWLGLKGMTGWWNAVHAADLDGDNRSELVLGNHGLNSRFSSSPAHPVRMWVGNFEGNGIITQILSMPRKSGDYPVALRHELLEQLPSLKSKYPDYASYGEQTVQDIFTTSQLDMALQLEAAELSSLVIWNEPDGVRIERLPLRGQLAPLYGLWSGDLSGDGRPELVIGGNLKQVKPVAGPYQASYGVVLTQKTDGGWASLPAQHSGLQFRGAVRRIAGVTGPDGQLWLVVARNSDPPMIFRINPAER